MAVTVEQIRAEFPEFAKTGLAVIEAKLREATDLLNAGELGVNYDAAVKYQACHLIASSPYGEFARIKYPHLEKDGASTVYQRHLNELFRRSVLATQVA